MTILLILNYLFGMSNDDKHEVTILEVQLILGRHMEVAKSSILQSYTRPISYFLAAIETRSAWNWTWFLFLKWTWTWISSMH